MTEIRSFLTGKAAPSENVPVVVDDLVMGTSRVDIKLAEIASANHGVVSNALAAAVDVGGRALRRRVAIGRLECIYPGVFRLAGCPDTWHQRVAAAVLAGGADTVASHRSACALWGLRGFGWGRVEVLSARWRRLAAMGIRAHESTAYGPADLDERDDIATLSIERTLLLIGSFAGTSLVEAALDDAIRQGLTTEARVTQRLRELAKPGRNGVGPMREVLRSRSEIVGLTRSVFETSVIELLRGASLPIPIRNHEVVVANGQRVELDLAFPEYRLFIELDSEAHHLDIEAFHRDRAKQNQLVLLGLSPLRFTYRQFKDRPRDLVGQTRAALIAAGWTPPRRFGVSGDRNSGRFER